MTRPSPRSAESQDAEATLRSGACTVEENRFCADCGTTRPEFICLTLGTFICRMCAEIQRGMSNRNIKDIYGGTLTMADVRRMENVGNEVANRKFLATWDPREYPEPAVGDRDSLREFIWLKYEGSWTRKMERERLRGRGDKSEGASREVVRGRETAIFRDGGLGVRTGRPGSGGRRSYWAEKFDKGDVWDRDMDAVTAGRRREDEYYGAYGRGRGGYEERGDGYRERLDRYSNREWERGRERDDLRDRYWDRDRERAMYQELYGSRERSRSRDRTVVYNSDSDEDTHGSSSKVKERRRSDDTKRNKKKLNEGRKKKSSKKAERTGKKPSKKKHYSSETESSEEQLTKSPHRRSRRRISRRASVVEDDDSEEEAYDAVQKRKGKSTKRSPRQDRRETDDDESGSDAPSSGNEYETGSSERESDTDSVSGGGKLKKKKKKKKRSSLKKKDKAKEKETKHEKKDQLTANGFGDMGEHKAEFDLMSELMDQPKHGPPQSSQLSATPVGTPVQSAPQMPPAQMPPAPPVSFFPGMPMGMVNGQMIMGPPVQPGVAFPQPMILPNGSMMMPMMPQHPIPQSMPMVPAMPNELARGVQNMNLGAPKGTSPQHPPAQQPPK